MPIGRPHIAPGSGAGAQSSQNTQKSEGASAPAHYSNSQSGTGYKVVASDYSGPGGGSCGNLQDGKLHFAELSNNYSAPLAQLDFSALGHLPCGTELAITYNGKTVKATKADVGAGGPGIGGTKRAIDLYMPTAQALGFSGLAYVYIARTDGKPIDGLGKGTTVEGNEASSGAIPGVSGVAGAIEELAKAIGFIFSLQFLYLVGGFIMVILALIFLLNSTKTGSQVVHKGAEAAGAAALL